MVKPEPLVLVFLLVQRDIDTAVRQVNAAARRAGTFQSERLLVELCRFLSIRNDNGDMTNSGHEGTFLVLRRTETSRFRLRGNPPADCIRRLRSAEAIADARLRSPPAVLVPGARASRPHSPTVARKRRTVGRGSGAGRPRSQHESW